MFASIRTRLTLSHLAVIIVAMGLSGSLLLSLLERYFLEAMESSLVAQAQITAQALVPASVVGTLPVEPPASVFNTLQQRQESNIALQAQNVAPSSSETPLGGLDLSYLADASLQLSSQLDTRIRILDAQGLVLLDTQEETEGIDLEDDLLAMRALTGQSASQSVRSGPSPTIHLAMPITVEGQVVGVVYLSQSLRDALAVIRDLRTRWLLSTLIALFLSGLVGLVLSGAIARPVRRLTEAAAAVARGQLDERVPIHSRDELGRLSRTFNAMTSRLRAARQVQVDFVANVSHELRTPLTAIKGTVETLRDGAVDDPDVRDRFLETVEDETDRLIRLVNDLLILSRADSEVLNLQCEAADVVELVQATAEKLAARAQANDILLRISAGPDTPLVWADADRIEQVLVNLLDNAIKFSRPGGVVMVRADADGAGSARVQVCDEGIGIPAEDLPRIGERFYRADRARSRSEGGSGLGLAIAQALVEAHGGQLSVDSREGERTVVTFTLPSA